jgi:hypothetical protein
MDFFNVIFNTVLFAAPHILLCRKMLGSNTRKLRLRHGLSEALTTRLDVYPHCENECDDGAQNTE